jgi:hypothetical protein
MQTLYVRSWSIRENRMALTIVYMSSAQQTGQAAGVGTQPKRPRKQANQVF